VPGLTADEGLLAYSGSSWDSRLMISGVESLPTVGDFVLEICNWTPSTNLAAGSGSVTLLRF